MRRLFDEQPAKVSVRRGEKTTIHKGEIVRKSVWYDSLGNELDQIGPNKFSVAKQHHHKRKDPIVHGYPPVGVSDPFMMPIEFQLITTPTVASSAQHDLDSAILSAVAAFLCVMLVMFFLGFSAGAWVQLRRSATLAAKNSSQPNLNRVDQKV